MPRWEVEGCVEVGVRVARDGPRKRTDVGNKTGEDVERTRPLISPPRHPPSVGMARSSLSHRAPPFYAARRVNA